MAKDAGDHRHPAKRKLLAAAVARDIREVRGTFDAVVAVPHHFSAPGMLRTIANGTPDIIITAISA